MWAAEWYSNSKKEGEKRHLIYYDGIVLLFKSKKKCQDYIKERWGYIATRKDLRSEPHGWRMPQPVRVTVQVI